MPAALVAALAVAVALVATAGAGCGRRGDDFALVTDSLIARPDGGELRFVRLRDRRGVVHEAWLRLPAAPAAPLVPVVILGGIGTGRAAATLVPCPPGYALLALDYPYDGPRAPDRDELLAALPAIHRAAHATPPGVTAAVRWLSGRPDMDGRGALLVGASFGVPFVLRGMAALPRTSATDGSDLGPAGVRAVCLLYGGADLPNLARYRLRDRPRWEREAAAWGLGLFFADLEPARWIGRAAPRPVLFLNGSRDELVGEASTRLLHARARDPKTVVWLDTEHMRPEADSLLIDLVQRARGWLEEVEADSTDRGPRSPTRRGEPRTWCGAVGEDRTRSGRRVRRGGSGRSGP